MLYAVGEARDPERTLERKEAKRSVNQP